MKRTEHPFLASLRSGHGGKVVSSTDAVRLIRDGDMITIDAQNGTIDVGLSDAELAERLRAWQSRRSDHQSGCLWRYSQTVGDAEKGAVTHPGACAGVIAAR